MDLIEQVNARIAAEYRSCRNRILMVWGVVGLVNMGVIFTALTW